MAAAFVHHTHLTHPRRDNKDADNRQTYLTFPCAPTHAAQTVVLPSEFDRYLMSADGATADTDSPLSWYAIPQFATSHYNATLQRQLSNFE